MLAASIGGFIAAVALLAGTAPASAADSQPEPCEKQEDIKCFIGGPGGGTEITDPAQEGSPGDPGSPADEQPVGDKRPTFEYTYTPGCPGNDPNSDAAYDVACAFLVTSCQDRGEGPGPLTWVWRRPTGPGAPSPNPWLRVAYICGPPAAGPDAVPPRPQLTVDQIRRAFRQVAFARPALHVQPEGNVTLVNLPTYYEVTWPDSGFEPGEVATVNLLGRSVRIRPLAKTYTYRFGDGGSLGPTSDDGGTYPDGTVRHTYERAATVSARVTATYSGEFSVDGGEWQEVGETVDIAGPAASVEIRRARSRLEAG